MSIDILMYNKKKCRDPGSNRGPLDLQSNALPTELSRHILGCNYLLQNFLLLSVLTLLFQVIYAKNIEEKVTERLL